MHPLHLMSEDDGNNICASDTRIIINAYVLRELDGATCIASILKSGFFPGPLLCFLFQIDIWILA